MRHSYSSKISDEIADKKNKRYYKTTIEEKLGYEQTWPNNHF